jgi:hypothetical protein
MKEMNLPETRLRAWQPRRPSAGLKRRIFSADPGRSAAAWLVGSLAPVGACALLTLLVFNSGTGFPAGSARHEPMLATVLSNQSYAAYVADGPQSVQNRLFSVILDWTNDGGSTSNLHFTPFAKPNDRR